MVHQLLRHRRFLAIGVQLLLVVLANYGAFWIRFDGQIPAKALTVWLQMLPWLVLIRSVLFFPFRLHEGLWRYAGIWDLGNIIAGVATSTLVFFGLVHGYFGLPAYPRSVFVIDTMLLIFFLGGIRLGRRMYRRWHSPQRKKKMLVYGAGDAGEMVVRDMQYNDFYDHEPIGFIDDDDAKVGLCIHGVPVLGTGAALPRIMEQKNPDEVLIAIPRADPATIRRIVHTLEPLRVPIKVLPSLHDIVDNTVTVSQIRDLSVEDLLARPKVQLDMRPVRQFVQGKRVLVTGAGGSIGSELCRQLARLNPEVLILLDMAESALYDINMELGQSQPACPRVAFLADLKHVEQLHRLFRRHRPQLVFHAAAYKHVPIMETHPDEAVFNNILSTCRLSQVAVQYGVETFVQISTDKAVNPTNVMGASKRICELYIQSLAQQQGQTVFCGVRFGNVLGSNGSVVPVFLRQIKEGGPVTVTHPAISRYFMTIPEASQLVLRASTLAKGGEIFVLDMGEQVKVVELARQMIRLAGFVPEEEIPIVYTGLRPGEKLYEELVERGEVVEPSGVEKIQRVHPHVLPDATCLAQQIALLEQLAVRGDAQAVVPVLRKMVPTFLPQETPKIPWGELNDVRMSEYSAGETPDFSPSGA